MKTHDAELRRITDLLRSNTRGMKITRIASELSMNRNAASKYLEILLMTGQVEVLEHGMSRIFILSRKTAIPTMLDGSSDLILVLDHEMRIARANENFLKFTGMKPDDILGRRVDAAGLSLLAKPPVPEKIRQARFGEDVRTGVKEILADGRELFLDIRFTPAVFNDGNRGITIVISDITEEKKRQEAADNESRKLVEGVLSCIDDAVILLEFRSGAVSFLNPAARTLFGYPDKYPGTDEGLLSAIAGTDAGDAGRLEKAFRLRGYFETESRMKRNGGSEFPASLQLRPVYDTNGGIRNIVMIVRDLSAGTRSGQPDLSGARDPVLERSPCRLPGATWNPVI